MNLLVLARRTITFRQVGRGDVTVLMVPGRDQIQIVKDLAGMSDVNVQPNVAHRGPQLSRVFSGQRYIYGYLPEEIKELQQAVKVWLAEDFAPANCQAFFYVFSPEVIIQGVRETADEGQMSWRTAQLVLSGEEAGKALTNAVTDYVLANPTAVVCVAVLNQLELYQKLQTSLQAYGIEPVPFTTLKPLAGVRPLYRQFDHTLIYLTSILFGILMLLGSIAFYFLNWAARTKLESEIADVKKSIESIQLNQSTGHIREPQLLLDIMAKGFNQQPSAIVDAAARFAVQFGELTQVTFQPPEMAGSAQAQSTQQEIIVNLTKSKDKLLFDQERRARALEGNQPWVRSARRTGSAGEQTQMVITVQSDQAPLPTDEQIKAAATPVDTASITSKISSSLAGVSGSLPVADASSTLPTSPTAGAGQQETKP